MLNDEFERRLDQLSETIKGLPEDMQKRMQGIVEETKTRRAKIKDCEAAIQENVDYLRMSVKYLVFDLEATRRENAELRKRLGELE